MIKEVGGCPLNYFYIFKCFGNVHYNWNVKTSFTPQSLPLLGDNHQLPVFQVPGPQPASYSFRYFPLHADSLTVSASGSVALQSGVDIQCYNYTLANPFNCTPGVAIGTIFITQRSTTFSLLAVTTYSSPSRQWTLIATESSPSLSEPNGAILVGAGFPSHLLLRSPLRSTLDIIRLTLLLYQHASLAKKSLLSSP